MQLQVYPNNQIDQMALSWWQSCRTEEKITDFFLPAGGTPQGLFKLIRDQRPKWLEGCEFYQVDDILTGKKAGEFHQFFKDELGPYYSQLIRVGEAKRMLTHFATILGLGMNGHIAFHEPHLPQNFYYGCMDLGPETLKYLDLAPGTKGVSYGLYTFLRSKKILVMVKGQHKASILKRLLEEDQTVPAVGLLKHAEVTIMVDEECWDTKERLG